MNARIERAVNSENLGARITETQSSRSKDMGSRSIQG
jgi:hypothetical protein